MSSTKPVTLPAGITNLGPSSPDDGTFIFAGTSVATEPSLQFIGPATPMPHDFAEDRFTASSLHGAHVYGDSTVNHGAHVTLEHGIQVNNGSLTVHQTAGATLTLDGTSSVNDGSTLSIVNGGGREGSVTTLNGDITVGSQGANTLDLTYTTGMTGTGTIRQTGHADVTKFGSGGSVGQHLDIRAGKLEIGNTYGNFQATIGSDEGEGPAIGRDATVQFDPQTFLATSVTSADFNTASGLLSLKDASGAAVFGGNIHFSGDAHGLNIAAQTGPTFGYVSNGTSLSFTDHPGTASAIPIKFS